MFVEHRFRIIAPINALIAVGIFMILIVVILVIGNDKMYVIKLLFTVIYILLSVSIALILSKKGDGNYGSLFAYGLSLRLALVSMFTLFPPNDLIGINQVKGILFEDESFYVGIGRSMGANSLSGYLDLSNPYERAAAIYAFVFSIFGDDLIWSRMFNALITSCTSVLIYDTVVNTTSRETHRFGWWLAGFSPDLLLWSLIYVKEPYLTFGVALIVNYLLLTAQGLWSARLAFFAVIGTLICLWFRGAVIIIPVFLAIMVPFAIGDKARKIFFLPTVFFLLICVSLISIAALPIAQFIGMGSTIIENSYNLLQRGEFSDIVRFPFFDFVSQLSPGILQTTGFAFLLILSPVITSLFSLIPFLGNPSWLVFAVSAYALNWWICLPFIIAFGFVAIKRRDGWMMALVSWLVLWIYISATMRAGAGYDAFRYREALIPLITVLAVHGLDSIRSGVLNRRLWSKVLRLYWVIVLGLIFFRGLGIMTL